MIYDEFRAMNSDILLAAEGEPEMVAEGFGATRSYIADCESRFTRFSEESELSQLNRTSGGWFIASPDMFDVVTAARRLMDLTCGLFDPAILVALQAAGYDRSMDEIRTLGQLPERRLDNRSPWPISGFNAVEFKPSISAIHLPHNVQIDLGGIAKGWIAERAARLLSAYALACTVSAGGDMYLAGLPKGENRWGVSLEDPRDPIKVLAVLQVPESAVATSSITKRRWVQGQQIRHHIIDPRSGEPAETDWLSVTVIADHTATAEAFAKALLIAGSAQSQVLADRQSGLEFIGVKQDGSLWGSRNCQEYLDVSNQRI
jgi:FAD:protein FMN transferase